MVSERIQLELTLLRTVYPDLEWRPDTFWARIPAYPVPHGPWQATVTEAAFRIPPTVGEQPYAFFVRPGLTAVDGRPITNYTFPVATCFGDGWGQFSWAPEAWAPHVEITRGSNMLNFVRSFADRLREGP
jgi:hypothetical protein